MYSLVKLYQISPLEIKKRHYISGPQWKMYNISDETDKV